VVVNVQTRVGRRSAGLEVALEVLWYC
jgi:hypothetical protein